MGWVRAMTTYLNRLNGYSEGGSIGLQNRIVEQLSTKVVDNWQFVIGYATTKYESGWDE